jgi:hypothetical protein
MSFGVWIEEVCGERRLAKLRGSGMTGAVHGEPAWGKTKLCLAVAAL